MTTIPPEAIQAAITAFSRDASDNAADTMHAALTAAMPHIRAALAAEVRNAPYPIQYNENLSTNVGHTIELAARTVEGNAP